MLRRRRRIGDAAKQQPFGHWKSFGRDYERQLRKVSGEIRRILETAKTEPGLRLAESRLKDYVRLLSPWADLQAERMVMRVYEANERRWGQYVRQYGFDLRGVMQHGALAPKIAEMQQEAAHYIRSLPLEASVRVGELARTAAMYGMRPEAIEENLKQQYGMTENRARLIARTEVARSNSILVQARAESLGSKAYIWQAAEDSRVRESHLEMNGKVCYWDNPPTLSDGTVTHPGQIYNCRCIALPLLSDEELNSAVEAQEEPGREKATPPNESLVPEINTVPKSEAEEFSPSEDFGGAPDLALFTKSNTVIPDEKLVNYSLNLEHKDGKNKAVVFESALGYNKSNAAQLKQALYDGLENAEKKFSRKTEYGNMYVTWMDITGPNGKTAKVKSSWIIRNGETKPQLINTKVEKKKKQGMEKT